MNSDKNINPSIPESNDVLKKVENNPLFNTLESRVQSVERKSMRFLKSPRGKLAVAGFLSVVLVVGGVTVMSLKSLPGDFLYGVKVGDIERVEGVFNRSDKDFARYDVTLLERRLTELQVLHAQSSVSEKAREVLRAEIARETTDFMNRMSITRENQISRPDALWIISDFAATARAAEVVSENSKELNALGEDIEDIRGEAVNLFKDTAKAFVSTGNEEEIKGYIAKELTYISSRITDEGLSAETKRQAQRSLYDVEDAIAGKDMYDIIKSAEEGIYAVKVESYLDRDASYVPVVSTKSATTTTSVASSTATTTGN